MDYKDKLKLAKEALDSGSYDKETIEYIFPELAESEDERIKGAIIDHLKDNNLIEWAAWLEKQGEQKPKWGDDDEQYLLVCKNALRKYQVSDKWDAEIISKWLEDKLKH